MPALCAMAILSAPMEAWPQIGSDGPFVVQVDDSDEETNGKRIIINKYYCYGCGNSTDNKSNSDNKTRNSGNKDSYNKDSYNTNSKESADNSDVDATDDQDSIQARPLR
jgi:hypothetical protein